MKFKFVLEANRACLLMAVAGYRLGGCMIFESLKTAQDRLAPNNKEKPRELAH